MIFAKPPPDVVGKSISCDNANVDDVDENEGELKGVVNVFDSTYEHWRNEERNSSDRSVQSYHISQLVQVNQVGKHSDVLAERC